MSLPRTLTVRSSPTFGRSPGEPTNWAPVHSARRSGSAITTQTAAGSVSTRSAWSHATKPRSLVTLCLRGDEIADHLGICLAARCLHHLADQEPERLGVSF